MSHAVVTVETGPKQRLDLALPLNVPNLALSSELAKALNLPVISGRTYLLAVKTEEGVVRLPGDITLGEAGVLDGFILQLHSREDSRAAAQPADAAFLQAGSGEKFALVSDLTVIGRSDIKRGVVVDIDIAPFDSAKIVSRRHAVIERKQEQYTVIDRGSVNGTWLNDQRLVPHQAYSLRNGDVLLFGRNGVQLKFMNHEPQPDPAQEYQHLAPGQSYP